jgi:ATP-dependent phosphofructokinase / diphosphate-dependent phosphofructokinase
MEASTQRIAILTSGGDAPGLNAVIRSVVKTAILRHGWEVVGIRDGFEGLIGGVAVQPLGLADVSGMLPRGGSLLGCTNRGHLRDAAAGVEDGNADALQEVVAAIRTLRVDALIVVGGDGSHRIAAQLSRRGVPLIGVPKTIDNDLPGTETSFGFDSAVAFATDAIDRLHTTAESHGRALVVEVMGREAGWIALHAGIAGGADVILIPEIPYDLTQAAAHIRARASAGKRFSIVVAAEGAVPAGASGAGRVGTLGIRAGTASRIADELQILTGHEARAVVLGHLQRGGTPTAADRLLATALGAAAVSAVAEGQFGRALALRAGHIQLIPISEATGKPRLVPLGDPLLEIARGLGISFAAPDESVTKLQI